MNYLSGLGQLIYTPAPVDVVHPEQPGRRLIYAVGALYGLQRNYNSRISLDINFGVGGFFGSDRLVTFDNTNQPVIRSVPATRASLLARITFGIWLGRKS